MRFWREDGAGGVVQITLEEYVADVVDEVHTELGKRIVCRDEVDAATVSTVFLATDAEVEGEPVLYETMIYVVQHELGGRALWGPWKWRYRKRAEAEAGHRRVVAAVRDDEDYTKWRETLRA